MAFNGRTGKRGFCFYSPDAGVAGGNSGSAGGSQAGGSSAPGGDPGAGGKEVLVWVGENPPDGYISPEQFNKVVQERLTRERNKMNGEIDRKLKDEFGLDKDSVDGYKKWKSEREKAEFQKKHDEGKFQEIIDENQKRHQREIEERDSRLKSVETKYRTSVIRSHILSVANAVGAVAPDDVFVLTQSQFRVREDEGIEVIDPKTGDVAYGKDGKPHTPKSFLVEWLQERPHFLKASGAGGSGTPGGKGAQSGASGQKFFRSQLRDAKFYQANRDAILLAQQNGQIIDDTKGR